MGVVVPRLGRQFQPGTAPYPSLLTLGQGQSLVAVLDANNPNNVIETFDACDSHLLSMCGVPGALEADPLIDESSARKFLTGGGKLKEVPDGLKRGNGTIKVA